MAINFDTVVQKMIAKPCTRDGIPLFARVDGKIDNGLCGTKNIPENSEYTKRSRQTCTSPDNLKRLFITYNGVYVHLHRPVVGSSKGASLKREYSYPKDVQEVIDMKVELYRDGLRYGSQFAQVRGIAKTKEGKAVELRTGRELEMDGFGFKAIARPHVYQNIEEIYFDWIVISNMASDRGRDFGSYLSSAGSIEKAIKLMVYESCGDLLKRYPRLHTICFMENLEGVYKALDNNMPSNFYKPWISELKQKPNGIIQVVQLRKDSSWIANWSVKDGIYVFDRDVLAPHAEKVKRKYIEESEKEREKALEEQKCSKESMLDCINDETSDKRFLKAVLKSMVINGEITVKEIDETFSEQGKRKYIAIASSFGR